MQSNRRFILNIIIAYLAIMSTLLFLELTLYFVPNPSICENHAHFYYLAIASIGAIIMYFILEKRHNKAIDIKPIILIIASIVLITGLIVIWIQPEEELFVGETKTLTAVFTNMDKFNYSIRLVAFLGCALLIIHATTHKKHSLKSFHWMHYLIIAVGLVSIVASLILEWDKYVMFASLDTTSETFPKIESLFGNENVFGMVIMFSMSSTLIVREMRKRWWHLPLYYLFFVELILTSSLTSIISVLILTIAYIVFKAVIGLKHHLKAYLIRFAIYGSLCVGIILLFYFGKINEIKPFSNLVDFLQNEILSKDFTTLTQRTTLWYIAWLVISKTPTGIIFGRGYGLSIRLFNYQESVFRGAPLENGVVHTHSGYVDLFMNFGLLGLIIYLAGIVYFIFCIIRIFKSGKIKEAFIFLMSFIMYSTYLVAEEGHIFKGSMNGWTFAAIYFMPVITYSLTLKKKEDTSSLEKYCQKFKEKVFDRTPMPLMVCFMLLFPTIMILTNVPLWSDPHFSFSIILLLEIVLSSIFIFPLLSRVLNIHKKGYALRALFYSIGVNILPITFYVLSITEVVSIFNILWLPFLLYVSISLVTIFLIYIINERWITVEEYLEPFAKMGVFPILASLVGGFLVFIFSTVTNVVWPFSGVYPAIVVLIMGYVTNLFICLLPSKMKYCRYIDCYNSIYNRYELFMLKREDYVYEKRK